MQIDPFYSLVKLCKDVLVLGFFAMSYVVLYKLYDLLPLQTVMVKRYRTLFIKKEKKNYAVLISILC